MEKTINNFLELVEEIKKMETYKQILKDSFGGIMYDVANKNKYPTDINQEFNKLESLGFDIWTTTDGIFRGVHGFIMKEEV